MGRLQERTQQVTGETGYVILKYNLMVDGFCCFIF